MDNNINFNSEQINELLSILGSGKKEDNSPDEKTVRDFIGKNLNASQADVLKKALENPEIIKTLLSSPKAQKLFQKYTDKDEEK